MTPRQLVTAMFVVLVTMMVAFVVALRRGPARRWAFPLLLVCAGCAIASWTDYGRFQAISVDATPDAKGPGRAKIRERRPFHFHELVHYYLGPKYFAELGYLGLYDCIALADTEIAAEDRVPRRISGYVRDLDDVLRDKTHDEALASCRDGARTRFSDERWRAFEQDIRELQRLVDDNAWATVVYDAGFNPPPSLILFSSRVANAIPLRSGTTETFVFATSIDLVLLLSCAIAAALAFGRITACTWAVYFGATFLTTYAWNGGSLLRFSWLAAIVFGLAAIRRGRWALAGALFAAATADRVFPLAFGACAMIPVAARALRSARHRVMLRRFSVAFAVTLLALFAASAAVYGVSAWNTFFTRTLHHGDIYYVFHVGLKKVLTFRDWVPSQNFQGHDGLMNFRAWNLRLHDTWSSMRPVSLLLQTLALGSTIWASLRRRPHEGALLGGLVFMFFFNLPANYYFVVATLAPALLLRAAATSPTAAGTYRSLVAFGAFNLFWVFTFISPQTSPDAIIYNFYTCALFLAFFAVWIAAWCEPRALAMLRSVAVTPRPRARASAPRT